MKTWREFSVEAIFHIHITEAIKELGKYECIKIKHF